MSGRFLGAFLALFVATEATAGDFTVATGVSPGAYAFDAPDGHYQSFTTPVHCPINAVRGSPVFTRLGTSTQWTPSVSIAVKGGGNFITLFIFAPDYHSPLIGGMIRAPDGHKDHPFEELRFSSPTNQDGASFVVTWNRDGVVTARLGSEQHSMRLGAPVAEVEIGGVSSAGVIRPLEIGHVAGVDAEEQECRTRS